MISSDRKQGRQTETAAYIVVKTVYKCTLHLDGIRHRPGKFELCRQLRVQFSGRVETRDCLTAGFTDGLETTTQNRHVTLHLSHQNAPARLNVSVDSKTNKLKHAHSFEI